MYSIYCKQLLLVCAGRPQQKDNKVRNTKEIKNKSLDIVVVNIFMIKTGLNNRYISSYITFGGGELLIAPANHYR